MKFQTKENSQKAKKSEGTNKLKLYKVCVSMKKYSYTYMDVYQIADNEKLALEKSLSKLMSCNEYKEYLYEGIQYNIEEIDDIVNNLDLTEKCNFQKYYESIKIDLEKCSEEEKEKYKQKYIDMYYPYLVYTHPYTIEEIKVAKPYMVKNTYEDGLPSEDN